MQEEYNTSGTRYPDPFSAGIAYAQNINYNYTSERERYESIAEPSEIAIMAIKWLGEHGETRTADLARHFGIETSHLKNQLTQPRRYESDDGAFIGILNDDGDRIPTDGHIPKPFEGERLKKSRYRPVYVIDDEGDTVYYKSIRSAVESEPWLESGVAAKTLSGKNTGITGRIWYAEEGDN